MKNLDPDWRAGGARMWQKYAHARVRALNAADRDAAARSAHKEPGQESVNASPDAGALPTPSTPSPGIETAVKRRVWRRRRASAWSRKALVIVPGLIGAFKLLEAARAIAMQQWAESVTAIVIAALAFSILCVLRASNGFFHLVAELQRFGFSAAKAKALRPLDDKGAALVELLDDWAEASEAEMSELRKQAQNDSLTALPNRAHFRKLVEARLATSIATRGTPSGAMFYLDIDDFKIINDTLGHKAGDKVLVQLSRRISLAISDCEDAVIGRLGGDEFGVFCPGTETSEAAIRLARRIRHVLADPIEIKAGTTMATCSIGVAVAEPAHDFSALLAAADVAMYAAKSRGNDHIQLFDAQLAHKSDLTKLIESDIRSSLSDGGLSLVYQPQFDCQTREIVSAEALLRWEHRVAGTISPDKFIPIIEQLGLIGTVGEWVIDQAVATIAENMAAGKAMPIAVNVSPLQLQRSDFAAFIKATLKRWDVPPHLLELEITESTAMDESAEIDRMLAQLRASGVRISIDDFGMGYSNLTRVARLPIDKLKIDKSMIDDLADRIESQVLVKSIIRLSHDLGLMVVAEGIETESQLETLVSLGCEIGQGYLVSPPLKRKHFLEVGHNGSASGPALRVVWG